MKNEKGFICVSDLIEDLKWLKSVVNEYSKNEVQDYIDRVETFPKVDAVEVKHGRWLFDSNTERYFCSACNEQALCTSKDIPEYDYDWEENLRYSHTETIIEEHLTNYCPNCGAYMRNGDGNA